MQSKEPRKRGPAYYYTVYDRKENVVAFGTADAVCKKLGIQRAAIYSHISRSKRQPDKESAMHIVKERLKADELDTPLAT